MSKRKLAAIISVVICGCGVFAAPWSTHSSRRRPETMLVIGNYLSPYVLAETYHGLTNQPYLRVMQDGRLYITMPKAIYEVKPGELSARLDGFGLKRIVIVGDERYVSADFEKELRKTNIKATPLVRIYGDNWLRIAEELDDLLNVGHLARDFRDNYQDAVIRTKPATIQPRRKPVKPEAAPAAAQPAQVEFETIPAESKAAPVEAKAAPAPKAPEIPASATAPAPKN